MAFDDAGIDPASSGGYTIGFALGSQWGCTGTMEKFQQKLLDSDPKFATPFLFSSSFPNSPAAIASIEFSIKGYNTVYSGCVNSGFMACINALYAVKNSRAAVMAVVGADALSRTVTDYYKDSTPPSDCAACMIIGSEKQDNGVEIRDFSLSCQDLPDTEFQIRVEDNVVFDNKNREIGTGNSMAGAFPMGMVLAADAIRSGSTNESLVVFKSEAQTGYMVLR
jgi:hypothetical protein